MTQPLEASMIEHIAFLEDAVHRMDLHHARLQTALSETQAALEDARRAVAARAAEEAALLSSVQSLAAELAVRRQVLETARNEAMARRVRNLLAHFPHDLFRTIFLHAAECDKDIWAENELLAPSQLPSDCIRAPFRLAAVNQQWRNVALDTPSIWSLLAVHSNPGSNHPALLEYVETLLRRSQTQDLDLIIVWYSESASHFQKIIDKTARHTYRWRRVFILLPDTPPQDASQFLLLPMPRLDQLRLLYRQSQSTLSGATLPSYLPICPRLRHLYLYSHLAPPRRQLPELIYLEISVGGTRPDVVWRTLRMLPALEILRFYCEGQFMEPDLRLPTASSPHGRLTMAHLRRISLYGYVECLAPMLSVFDMPRLWEIGVSIPTHFFSTLGPAFTNMAPSVTKLIISDAYAFNPKVSACMTEVRKLRELRSIVFRRTQALSKELGAAFASREAAGLPHLECVAFENPALNPKGEMVLSNLMHALLSNPAGGVTFSLTCEDEAVPDWLLQQYKYLARTNTTDPI